MADEIQLNIKPRAIVGKQVRALRRSGWIPLSLYGAHMQARNFQAEERALRVVLNKAGHNRLIYLDTGDGKHVVVAREIQREPISGKFWHVDFQEISLTEKMDVEVRIVFVGNSPAVQRNEGLLIHGLDAVTIRVLPTELISEIQVDVSGLQNVNDALHVSDIRVGDEIEILTSAEELIAKVISVREEVIEAEAPVATAEVEVVGKGKKEEEAAEGETAEAKK
jgi:large subunit ribosomal protein L25